jgi:hypothetical protein
VWGGGGKEVGRGRGGGGGERERKRGMEKESEREGRRAPNLSIDPCKMERERYRRYG